MAIDLSKNGWYIEYEYPSLTGLNQYKEAAYGAVLFQSENDKLTAEDIIAIKILCLQETISKNIVPSGWLKTSGFSLKSFQPLSVLLPPTPPSTPI